MVLCLFIYFLVLNFDWSIILIRKSFGASRHISGKLGVKLAIVVLGTYKNEEDPTYLQNEGARVLTSLYIDFSDAQV